MTKKVKKENKNILFNNLIKRQVFLTIITAFLLIFILIESSHAIFNNKTETGLSDVVVQSGNLLASISTEDGEIIENSYTNLGISDEIGLQSEPYVFNVENIGETTIAYYELRIVDKEYELSTLPHKSLNYVISKNGLDYSNIQNLGNNNSYIYVGEGLEPGTADSFSLKLWVNEKYGKYANNKELKASIELTLYSDIPTRNYIIYDTQGGSFVQKTNVTTMRTSKQIPVINGYDFLGWSNEPNGSVKYGVNSIYKEKYGTKLYAIWEEAIDFADAVKNTLGDHLTEPTENDKTRYVFGTEDNMKNYIWYSGMLWRIVGINEDNSIKIVTDDSLTMLALTLNNKPFNDFNSSLIAMWLDEVFYETLDNPERFIIDSLWDYTNYSSLPTVKNPNPERVITRKVGILDIYEFAKSGGTLSENTTNTYLNNGQDWWVMTPSNLNGNGVWRAFSNGKTTSGNGTYGSFGIRPSVVLKSDLMVSGTGTKNDPYTIAGDKIIAFPGELLNNRLRGEYILFDNVLYRIVEVTDEGLTKVTLADYRNLNGINKNSINTAYQYGNINFNIESGIGKYLLDWYNNNISVNYKNMIQVDGVKWYLGPDNGISYDYRLSKTGTQVETPIGLGYYGEMFSNHFDHYSNSVDTWLLTKYDSSKLWVMMSYGYGEKIAPSSSKAIRPSFYLKSNVKINDIDGNGSVGKGTKDFPYEISCENCL